MNRLVADGICGPRTARKLGVDWPARREIQSRVISVSRRSSSAAGTSAPPQSAGKGHDPDVVAAEMFALFGDERSGEGFRDEDMSWLHDGLQACRAVHICRRTANSAPWRGRSKTRYRPSPAVLASTAG